MARVTAYEASDGSLHRDKKAYLRHEANLIVANELRSKIIHLLDADTDEAHEEAEYLHDFIVNGIGLNTLRDLFAIQFKPSQDDGEDPQPPQGQPGGEAGLTAGAPEEI